MEQRRGVSALACLVLAVVGASCGSPSAPTNVCTYQTSGSVYYKTCPNTARMLSVQIVPDVSELGVNTSQQFSVVEVWGPGDPHPGPPPMWSTSDPSIAAVDQNGLVKALSPGTTILSIADYDGASDRRQLQVVPQS